MDSKTIVYYKVKPEFDQFTLRFKIYDRRHKENFRIVCKTLIAGELFTLKQYNEMLRQYSLDISDIFITVKCKSFISFGCRFDESEEFDYSLVDSLCERRKELLYEFMPIYEKYCRIKEGRFIHWTQNNYVNFLSIETLEFLIRYYRDLINWKG